ncbi:MAG: zinc metallopeptidase [Firmicutes bacterium]|nr:zinc metallopeptidase [Bacillota bacterium]
MYYGIDPTIIVLIPAIIFTIFAQAKVKSAYAKYSQIPCSSKMTGAQAARMILDKNNMSHVPIEVISGTLSDNYDPTKDVMHLSNGIAYSNSIAAVSVAAHESGHAIQDGKNFAFLKFRIAMVPIVNLASAASWPIIIIGIIMAGAGSVFGNTVLDIGILLFVIVVLFHAVTLPVELDASRRALQQMNALGIITAADESGAKKMLSAAAMTYVAALASSIASLIRILLIRGRD